MSEEINISKVIKILKQEKKYFFTMLIIPLILLGMFSMIMPHTFSSQASLLPPSKNSSSGLAGFLQTMAGGMSLGSLDGSSETKIYNDILNSRTVADYIIEKLDLQEHKDFKEMSKQKMQEAVLELIKTESLKSGMILITSEFKTSYMPKEDEIENARKLSAAISNTAIEALNYILTNNTSSKAKQSRIYIEKELEKYKTQLDSVTKALEEFQLEHNVLSIEDQAKAIIDQAVTTGSELLKYENELNLARIQYSSNAPMIKTLEKQVSYLKEQVRKLQIEGMEGSEFTIPLNDLPSIALQYAALYRDKEIMEQVILYLETQKHQEAIQENKDVVMVQTLDVAQTPDKRSSPKRTQLMIIALVFFSFISILLTIYRVYKKGELTN